MPPQPASYGTMESDDVPNTVIGDELRVAEHSSGPVKKGGHNEITLHDELEAIGFGRFHYGALAILGLANASDAVELLCLSFILPSLPASDVTDNGKATLSSAIFVGMLIGGLVFGIGADSYGRRTTLAVSLAINSSFGLMSAFTSNFAVLMVCRVMAGFGVGGSIPGVFTLAAELLPSKDRGYWLSTVAWWWMVGSLWAAGAAWLMIGHFHTPWQWYATVCAIPAGVAAVLVLTLLPESPRFLLTKGDAAGATRSLIWIARVNKYETRLNKGYVLCPADIVHLDSAMDARGIGADIERVGLLATAESRSMEEPSKLVADGSSESAGSSASSSELLKGVSGSGQGAAGKKKSSWVVRLRAGMGPVSAFFSPSHARTSVLLMIIWFCLSFGWYGLILWIPTLFSESDIQLDPYQDSFVVSAANLPGNILSALAMDRVGRKGVLASSLIAACAFAAAMPFAKTEVAAVAVACSLNAVSTATWNALDCLSTESFPTHLRTSALGLLAASGRAGSIVAQFVFGALIHVSTGALLGSAAGMLGIGALAALALPSDPMGKDLED